MKSKLSIKCIILVGIIAIYIHNSLQAGLVTIFDTTSESDKKTPRLIPITTTVFINGRINDIIITLTDNKNKTQQINIKSGEKYQYKHKPKDLKKVVCSEKNEKNITLNESDLNNYEVFVFNSDQKTEKYHFINIYQKEISLKEARKTTKNQKAIEEIYEQTVYNL